MGVLNARAEGIPRGRHGGTWRHVTVAIPPGAHDTSQRVTWIDGRVRMQEQLRAMQACASTDAIGCSAREGGSVCSAGGGLLSSARERGSKLGGESEVGEMEGSEGVDGISPRKDFSWQHLPIPNANTSPHRNYQLAKIYAEVFPKMNEGLGYKEWPYCNLRVL